MSGALLPIAIGLLLAVLLALIYRTRDSSDGLPSPGLPAIADVPRCAQRRAEILARMLDPEDWEFVRTHGSPDVQRLFHAERKKIALCWLSEIRNQARAVMQFHVTHARHSERILPRQELRLAVEYAAIRTKCTLIASAIHLGGPLLLSKIPGSASRLSDQLKILLELGLHSVAEVSGNSG